MLPATGDHKLMFHPMTSCGNGGRLWRSFLRSKAGCAAPSHLHLEAILASPESFRSLQAGRPFVVTDPNPPIKYSDLYLLIKTLAITRFYTINLQPIVMIIVS